MWPAWEGIWRASKLNQVPIGVGTENAPALANTPGCDASGNCNVQQVLMNNLEPTTYFVPYRGYTTISDKEWTGDSSYHSLQANYRHTVGHGLTFQAAYTWSHTIDDTAGTNAHPVSGMNDYDLSRWKATSSINQAQMLVMNYVYQMPLFAHSPTYSLGTWLVDGRLAESPAF